MKNESTGFGFNPSESKHHFLVMIPKSKTQSVVIYERFEWNGDETPSEKVSTLFIEQKIDHRFDRLKCELAYNKWKEIESSVKIEFNQRLKEYGQKSGNWKQGQNVVHKLFGKELTLLCWAIEDCDVRVIPTAIKNWLGLKPEERWWLFTMTNASTGDAHSKFGWRTAIRYALTENPISDRHQQQNIFDHYIHDAIEKNLKDKNGPEFIVHRNTISS